ncbi:hypothetical protein Ga0609869_000176 [Rhodovulum iodosum]|uniref:Lipoprotein n=1 Tax=Rhodovulum iodosum TaxID=68291 RepID=A0ABV3XR03_9RHOB|nr:hypothetical protein [Rhodovulum robiginosum]
MRKFRHWGLAPLVLAAFVAACADEIEEEIGECEPGLGDISQCADVTPPAI